ncbi:DNA translocase FtsK 4TM domain-containing protein [Neomegalonema sp.]|uniref:FtsK/SpoIIIE family DNA translocase n=1 Tax=Neomegalonema sp. TaxID=2039713 RepID=UPI0026325A60|nr:DNA translocase FtsK 4TM domain-containing protein [Neomegalonema sp.]MDD2868994.1 DNA translocase FtsK 4TM domain-containing protein [Neomegalonema sp.]
MTSATDLPPQSLRPSGPPRALGAAVGRWSLRLIALPLLAAALWLALALWSHNPSDPSWRRAVSWEPRNWMGASGANVSDMLRFYLGTAAWAPPAALTIWAANLWRSRLRWMVPPRMIAAALAVFPLTGFLSAYPKATTPGYGGRLGDIVVTPFAQLLASLGWGAPYMLPGMLMGLLACFAFLYGFGVTRADWRSSWRDLARGKLRAEPAPSAPTRFPAAAPAPKAPAPARSAARTPPASRAPEARDEPAAPAPGLVGTGVGAIGALLGAAASRVEEAVSPSRKGKDSEVLGATTLPPKVKRNLTRKTPSPAAGGLSSGYAPPPLSLLAAPSDRPVQASPLALQEQAGRLTQVLEEYGVKGRIVESRPGPVVTLHELEPAPGLKAARVVALADDIARSMTAASARVAVVQGRNAIGVELPNQTREKVLLREMLESPPFLQADYALALALGKTIGGEPMVADLARMPHLLIAGTTGSGKSVAINTMILSLLYRLSPRDCRLIMIDPKVLELSVYDGIPHLLAPVVTDPRKAVSALKWVVREMERRYRLLSSLGVRNLGGYNARVVAAESTGAPLRAPEIPPGETEAPILERLPLIVVVVDEMADLMLVAGKEVEHCVQRLAQMARASGIHLVMATQRPSVDVITGTIKANFPTRISFQVTSKIDSRTILGEQGAEQLLGQGDMLYMSGGGRVQRLHGPFVKDEEVTAAVRYLRDLGPPEYIDLAAPGEEEEGDALFGGETGDGEDELYRQAVAIVARDRKVSTSYIQRKLAIGYNRAARIVDMMEDNGVVGPPNNVGKREVLIAEE